VRARRNSSTIRAGELEIRPHELAAFAAGQPLPLTVHELALLTALAERAGRVVSREELYRAAWSGVYRKSDRSVDVYVGRLRQKLRRVAPGTSFIHTHFGFGYRLAPEPVHRPPTAATRAGTPSSV
jgi:DNA-binding response OmpR family regulator